MARSVSLLSLSWLCKRWRASCSEHDDVQPHGRAAEMAYGGSLREDHGLLSHAAWSRSTPIGDLRRLFETQVVGRNPGGSHIHFAGRDRDDRFELAVHEVWQAAASQ